MFLKVRGTSKLTSRDLLTEREGLLDRVERPESVRVLRSFRLSRSTNRRNKQVYCDYNYFVCRPKNI